MTSLRSATRFWQWILLASVAVHVAIILYGYRSDDYIGCLTWWISQIRELGHNQVWQGTPPWNYNVPYIYMLEGIAALPCEALVPIKVLSSLFDYVMAWFAGLILVELTGRRSDLWRGAAVTALLPTVLMNGAVWAQCDSVFCSFVVASIYYLIRGRGRTAMILYAIGFAFKFQAVFVAPLYLVLLLQKRLRWRELLWIPAVWIVLTIPSLAVGHDLKHAFCLYWSQINYTGLQEHMAAPTVWVLFGAAPGKALLMACVGAFGVAVVWLCCRAARLNGGDRSDGMFMVMTALVSCSALLFLLPGMHERYIYIGDILGTILFLAMGARYWGMLVPEAVSAYCYAPYLLRISQKAFSLTAPLMFLPYALWVSVLYWKKYLRKSHDIQV